MTNTQPVSITLDVSQNNPNYEPQKLLAILDQKEKEVFNPSYLFFFSLLLFVTIGVFGFDTQYLLLLIPVISRN